MAKLTLYRYVSIEDVRVVRAKARYFQGRRLGKASKWHLLADWSSWYRYNTVCQSLTGYRNSTNIEIKPVEEVRARDICKRCLTGAIVLLAED